MSNTYSDRWFRTFLAPIPGSRTEREISFLRAQLPLPDHRRILDLACGPGRHACGLATLGYQVTGVDVKPEVITEARRLCGSGGTFLQADMRDLEPVGRGFDAVICMWQSFGYFDAAENRRVLGQVAHALRTGGRLVLDIYDRRFFERHQGERVIERDGERIQERSLLEDGRLFVQLRYEASGEIDEFDWQLFTPGEARDLGRDAGLELMLACCDFDPEREAIGETARMQLIFEGFDD